MRGGSAPIFLIALGLSLLCHAGLYTGSREIRISNPPTSDVRSDAQTTVALLDGSRVRDDSEALLKSIEPPPAPAQPKKSLEPSPVPSPPPDAAKPIAVKPKPAAPDPVRPDVKKPEPPKPKLDVEQFPDRFGTHDGSGIGTHAAKGEQYLKAPKGDNDQPYLSRDDRGAGAVGDPTPITALPGENGTGGDPRHSSDDPADQKASSGQPQPSRSAERPAQPSPVAAEQSTDNEPPTEQPPSARPAQAVVGTFRPGPLPSGPSPADSTDAERRMDESRTDVKPALPAEPPIGPEEVPPSDAAIAGKAAAAQPGGAVEVPSAEQVAAASRADGILPPVAQARPETTPPPAALAPAPPPLRMPASVAVATPEKIVPPQPVTPSATESKRPNSADAPKKPTGDGKRPGLPSRSADPAQMSDSEVDPFSKIEAVVTRDGKVDPQFGRQVKTVRPKISFAGMIDAYTGAQAVTLRVAIATDGHVSSVRVQKSSGSNLIDQPCLVAMYDWWFEPLKDRSGQAIPDMVQLTLNFR